MIRNLLCVLMMAALLPTHAFASVTFSGKQTIRSGLDGADTVAAADFDGDGVPDVVGLGDEVVWALNGGDGSTWTATDLVANPPRARQLAITDLDGDDDLDIVYTDYDDDRVYRFINNLDTMGTFSGRGTVTVLNWADGVAAGDLDGDGDADLAVTSRQGDTYYWVENTNGAGTSWTLRTIQNFLDGAQLVAIGDLDQDGDLDVVGGGAESTPKLVWFENTDGDASTWTTHEIDDSWVNGIAVADIDLDGDPDIVISENDAGLPAATSDQVVWWENTDGEGGSWTENVIGGAGSNATDGVQVIDLDQDGDLDVVSSRNGDWFENSNGSATAWTVRSYSSDNNDIDDTDVADFDRDGDLDIVGARLEGDRLDWWENQTCSPTDLDSDGDDASDGCDVCDGFDDFADADGDTVPDGCDVCSGGDDRVDTDGNGTPDPCQATGLLSIGDVSMAEGDSGTTEFVFTVTLTGDVEEAFTVDYASADGSATTSDSDYAVASGTLAFVGDDGETETITVSVVGDTTPEGDETFLVELDHLSTLFADFADDAAVGTIEEDDVALSIDDVTATEGDSGTTDYVFTVTLDGEVAGGFTVEIGTQDGTAEAGGDYTSATDTLTFAGADGENETFTVSVNGDTVLEDDEIFEVVLSSPSDPTVGISDTGTGTIQDDDGASIAINDFTAAEGDSGTTVFVFTVALTGDVQGGFTVGVMSQDGTATAGSGDYSPVFTPLSFVGVDGETETFAVEVNGDLTVESDETFTVVLGTPSNGDVAVTDDTGVGTITNDDSASLAINDVTEIEGDTGSTDFLFVVTLTGDVEGGFTIGAQTQDGTAVAGSDYTARSSTLTFAGIDGETELFIVSADGDTVVEADETFTVALGSPSVGTVAVSDGTGLGTIEDDDSASVSDVAALEGDSGSTDFIFTATLTGEVQGGFTIPVDTQDGTAVAASDYTTTSATLTFDGTEGEQETFTVSVTGDTVLEADETFNAVLGSPSQAGVTVSDGTGLGTIENDDSTSISINDVTELEGDSGSVDYQFLVTLTGDVQGGFTIDAQTQDGTAAAGSDYTAASSTLSFAGADGEVELFTVSVSGDTVLEDDETFSVVLDSPSPTGLTLGDDTGLGTIENNDSASLSIGDVTALEGDAGSTDFVFTVTLTGDVQDGFTVGAQTQDGTATAGSDYTAASSTLGFAGTNGETQTFTVGVLGDTVAEPDEIFMAELGATSNTAVVVTDGTGQADILNDDGDPQGTLNVEFSGTGFATVTSSPTGIDCDTTGGTCSEAFDTGVEIVLSVETDVDTVFAGFTGDADCDDGRVSFAADGESVTCTANLAPSQPIFLDGFETGDTSLWSVTVGGD